MLQCHKATICDIVNCVNVGETFTLQSEENELRQEVQNPEEIYINALTT